jgi:hypothetical protein
MAKRGQKLKVFRTPIGFHDAYVAAPSQKAALAAWGSDSNLFAQGLAEAVTDPDLIKEPLASPGAVIRRPRVNTAEQLKIARSRHGKDGGPRIKPAMRKREKPDRRALEAAEAAIGEVEKRHRAELRTLDQAKQEIDRRRRDAERRQAGEHCDVLAERDRLNRAYDRAMKAWMDQSGE